MIENKFTINQQELLEVMDPALRRSPNFRKSTFIMPAVIVVLEVGAKLLQPALSIWLLLAIAAAMLYYSFSSMRKVPRRLAAQRFQQLKRESGERDPEIHTIVNEGGILSVGMTDEEDRIFLYSTIRQVFRTEHFLVLLNDNAQPVFFRSDAYTAGSEQALLQAIEAHCPGAKLDKSVTAAG